MDKHSDIINENSVDTDIVPQPVENFVDNQDTKTFEEEITSHDEINTQNSDDFTKNIQKVIVKPIKRTENTVTSQNSQSILSMCHDLDSCQPEIEPVVQKKKSGKKFVLGFGVASLFALAVLGGFSLSQYINNVNDINNNSIVSNSNSQSLDIITNVATDSSIDSVKEGDILTVPQIYEKVAPSTVGIQADTIRGLSGSGTGIIMSDEGFIITNNHVIDGSDILTVALHDGSLYNAEIIGRDEITDLAVIKITPDAKNPLVVAEFGDSASTVVGDIAVTIGNPGGLELQGTLTGGYISAINRDMLIEDRLMTLIQTDAAISPGNSGGPLINQYGQVIGINTVKISAQSYEGLGFAIPINDAKPIIDELISNGYVSGRPSIGISGYDISAEQASYNDIPQGLLVKSVDIRSDAYAKGLKENDIIIAVNGIETKSISEVNDVKDKYLAGDYLTLTIYRAGNTLDLKVMLMDANDLQTFVTDENQSQSNNNNYDNYDSYDDFFNNFGGFSFPFPFGY